MLNKKKLLVLACLGICAELPAHAEEGPFSANVSLTSNYLYRGISQTGGKPALQGGFDYTHSSGFYAGAWGSSISWLGDTYTASGGTAGANNAGLELDTYFGFKNSFATDFNYDVGFLRYNYPGSYPATFAAGAAKANTNEVYGLIGWKWISLKYSYSLGNTFGVADARGTDYVDLSANYPIEDTGFTLGAHYGRQDFKGQYAGSGPTALSYNDYRLGVSKDFSGYVVGVAYSKTNATAAYTVLGNDLGKGVVVASIARTF